MEIKRYGAKEFLAAGKLCIRENEIHIWCICWPEMTDFWVNHEYILSGQESEQVGRFRFSEDRMPNKSYTDKSKSRADTPSNTSFPVILMRLLTSFIVFHAPLCRISAPLGIPVVPDVIII